MIEASTQLEEKKTAEGVNFSTKTGEIKHAYNINLPSPHGSQRPPFMIRGNHYVMHIRREENRRRAQLGRSALKVQEDGRKLNGVMVEHRWPPKSRASLAS